MSDLKNPLDMVLTPTSEHEVDFSLFVSGMLHYAKAVRDDREWQHRKFLEGVVERSTNPSERATARAVFEWGPRMDISKMP